MDIRPLTASDLDRLTEIDSTVDSMQYLHVERGGEGLAIGFSIEPRPLRTKLIDRNAVSEDLRFVLKQVVMGIEDGMALAAEHEDMLVALMLAQVDLEHDTLRILDVRVDYDLRRQGLGSALLYKAIEEARNRELRAVCASTRANNLPAAQFFNKLGFDLAGLDTHFDSNHDLVKEVVSLFWYAALE